MLETRQIGNQSSYWIGEFSEKIGLFTQARREERSVPHWEIVCA